MSSLLQCAYVNTPCNSCGGSYKVTLLEMLMEHQVNREWQSPRPACSVCSLESRLVMWTIPPELLQQLERAWTDVSNAAEKAGVDLQLTAHED